MKNEERLARMREISKEIDRRNQNEPSEPDEGSDARTKELIQQGLEIQKQLDPMVREVMRDKPEALAEWDRIMHMCDDDDDEKPDDDDPGSQKAVTLGNA